MEKITCKGCGHILGANSMKEGRCVLCGNPDFPHKANKEPVVNVPCSDRVIKPPLGLKPKRIHKEQRYREVQSAIDRYCIDGLKIPVEWVEEYNELLDKMAL